MQLADFMWQETRTVEERISTARTFRVFPGEGVHSEQVAALVRRLDAMGYRGDYSFEVFNDDYQQLPLPLVLRARAPFGRLAGRAGAAPRGAAAGAACGCGAEATIPAATAGSTMPKILVLNGPNLNLLGTREPAIYGSTTLADVQALCEATGQNSASSVDFRQSNHEGVLIDWIHEAGVAQRAGTLLGLVFNAGAYTHTSLALHDAVKGAGVAMIEVHISNVHAREAVRHHSFLSPAAAGIVVGFGIDGYALACTAWCGARRRREGCLTLRCSRSRC